MFSGAHRPFAFRKYAPCQVGRYTPIFARLSGRFDRLAHHLDAALRVCIRAGFFCKTGSGQQNIGVAHRFGWKDFLHENEIASSQTLIDMVAVGIGHYRIFAQDIQCFCFSIQASGYHFSNGASDLIGHSHAPGALEFCTGILVRYRLISRVDIGQPSEIAGTLNVVLPAQRIYTASRNAHIAQEHLKVGQIHHIAHADNMLRDAHSPHYGHRLARCQNPGRFIKLFLRHSGSFCNLTRRILLQKSFEFFKAFGPPGDKLLILPTLLQDDMHQAVYQQNVGAGVMPQVQSGELRHINSPRISDNKLCSPAGNSAAKHRTEDGMLFARIGSDYEKSRGMLCDVIHGIGHGAGTEAGGQTGHGAAMSKTRTVIDIVRTDHLAGKLVH